MHPKALAEVLHKRECKSSHNDQCGWQYEAGDWTGYSHNKWLQIAERVIEEVEWRSRRYD